MSTLSIMILIGVAAIFFSIVGILSRYRKCKSNEILVVYGKTGKKKGEATSSSKLYHGGAAFVWPIVQGYEFMSMEPMQMNCHLQGAISKQKIRVSVPATVTVGISKDPAVMQNAADRLLGMNQKAKIELIQDIVYGQLRTVIANMTIEQLNADRDAFLREINEKIEQDLKEYGLYLMNLNISDLDDEAEYLKNQGKEAEAKAKNEALASIEEQQKIGAIKIAEQRKEKETKVAETEKEKSVAIANTEKLKATAIAETDKEKSVAIAETEKLKTTAIAITAKEQQIAIAEADRDRIAGVAKNRAEQEASIAEADALKEVSIEKAETEKQYKKAELQAIKDIKEAEALKTSEVGKADAAAEIKVKRAEASKKAQIGENKANEDVAISQSKLAVTKANAEKEAGEAQVKSKASIEAASENAQKLIEEAKALKIESKLKAEKIVPAQIAKEEAILEADAYSEKMKRQAEADAEAIRLKAKAEAEAIQMKLEAEAEGKKQSLMAEAEGFKAMVDAAESNPEIAIQYKLVDKYEIIAKEYSNAIEHVQIGDVKIYDQNGGSSAANFLTNTVTQVAPIFDVLRSMPLPNSVKNVISEHQPEEPGKLFEGVK
ncbi:MAG: SPFH domain-containing protein [Clostridia bacterium]